VTERPATRYAKTSDGVHIAYTVWGEGPIDLVMVPGFISHLDLLWDSPGYGDLHRRLGSEGRGCRTGPRSFPT
jgi:hypothetical protein